MPRRAAIATPSAPIPADPLDGPLLDLVRALARQAARRQLAGDSAKDSAMITPAHGPRSSSEPPRGER